MSVRLRAAVLRGWAVGDVLTLRICGKNVKRKDGGIFMSLGGQAVSIQLMIPVDSLSAMPRDGEL